MTFKLGKLEKAKLKEWMRETAGSYDVLMQLLVQRVGDIQAEPITGDSAFLQLQALHLKQGKVEGLTSFFNELEAELNV